MNSNQSNSGDSLKNIVFWCTVIGSFFVFPLQPLSIFLLIYKYILKPKSARTNGSSNTANTNYNNYNYRQTGSTVVHNTGSSSSVRYTQGTQGASAPRAKRVPPKEKNYAWLLIPLAVILFVVSAYYGSEAISDLRWGLDSYALSEGLRSLFYAIGGAGSLLFNGFLSRRAKRYAKYYAVVGDEDAMSVADISSATGFKEKTIRKDLGVMCEKGYFGPTAYFDIGLDSVVTSQDAAEAERQRRQAADSRSRAEAAKAEAPENRYMVILKKLRTLNDNIADSVISDKIDQIEGLSAKIFRIVEENPEKGSQITRFMDYYLPTTLKLLRSYSTLERQGIEGENITAAKQDIARILDTLIKGYEQQLDQLFKSDVLDISSDIDVLEAMMKKDGLGESGNDFKTAGGH